MSRIVVLALLCISLAIPSAAFAHGDESNLEELGKVYTGMLESVIQLQLAAHEAKTPADERRLEGAFTTAVLRFMKLYELTVKAECPECDLGEATKVDPGRLKRFSARMVRVLSGIGRNVKAAGAAAWRIGQMDVKDVPPAFGAWLTHVGKLGTGATGEIFARYGYTYGIIWAVATATFEALEHGPIPLHVGCAPFQAGFHLTAQFIRSFYRLGCSPAGDANRFRRMVNVFPANYYEWKFWWRMSSFFQKAPYLVVEEEETKRHFARLLKDTVRQIEKEVGEKSFSDEALRYFNELRPETTPSGDWTPPSVLEDLDIVFSGTRRFSTPEKMWVAQQHAEGLKLLIEPLARAVRARLDQMTFPEYYRSKRLVGALGRLVDEYSSRLIAAAAAKKITNAEKKKRAAAFVLGEIIEILTSREINVLFGVDLPVAKSWSGGFLQLFRRNDTLSRLGDRIRAIRKTQRYLGAGDVPDEWIPKCSTLLFGWGYVPEMEAHAKAAH